MGLASLTSLDLIVPSLPCRDGRDALRQLAEHVSATGAVRSGEDLFRKLWERELLGSTGIGAGVAIPHCKMQGLDRVLLAIGICAQGVDFGAVDGEPVRLFFLLVSPSNAPAEHLQSLAAVSRWVKLDHHVRKLIELKDAPAILRLLKEEEL